MFLWKFIAFLMIQQVLAIWSLVPLPFLNLTLCNPRSQNTGVGSISLLQAIFATQGSNPGLPHCSQFVYQRATREVQKRGFGHALNTYKDLVLLVGWEILCIISLLWAINAHYIIRYISFVKDVALSSGMIITSILHLCPWWIPIEVPASRYAKTTHTT